MHYTSLRLTNFRSYLDYSVELGSGVNIVVGPNASGKTNLLESILVASRGTSFRATDRSLINLNHDWLRIAATTNEDHTRIVTVKLVEENKTQKDIKIDNTIIRRMNLSKTVPTVIFEPEHLRMVSGSPERRRDYLDGILIQTKADYKSNLNRYKKALSQRNKLLKIKDRKLTRDDLFVWDIQLSEYGTKINSMRKELVSSINSHASNTYSAISGTKTAVEVKYSSDDIDTESYSSTLLRSLESSFDRDIMRGFTGIGPHRDDLSFYINGKEALISASRGEARSLVLVCKILEMELIASSYDKKPIILLDDVFSELDGSRRRALTEHLKDHQTIITTTDADAIVKSFLDGYTVIATDDQSKSTE